VGSDTTAFDGTVNGASFVQNGGVTDVVSGTGTNSGAYDFDGVDDFLDFGNISPIKNVSKMSFGAWVKNINVSAGTEMIGSFDSNFSNAIALIRAQAPPEIALNIQRSDVVNEIRVPAPADQQLHHFFGTFDSGTIELFIDGQSVGIKTNGPSQTPSIPLTAMTRDFQGRFIEGTADDIRFYNRALSASEINQIYENTDPDQ
jgi:hypothetical protein